MRRRGGLSILRISSTPAQEKAPTSPYRHSSRGALVQDPLPLCFVLPVRGASVRRAVRGRWVDQIVPNLEPFIDAAVDGVRAGAAADAKEEQAQDGDQDRHGETFTEESRAPSRPRRA